MWNLFRLTPAPQPQTDPSSDHPTVSALDRAVEEHLQNYLGFTRHPLQDYGQCVADLRMLLTHPFVTYLGFSDNTGSMGKSLLLVTTPVVITFEGQEYPIGRFLIDLVRYDEKGDAAPRILFENVSEPGSAEGGPVMRTYGADQQRKLCPHPHCAFQRHVMCMADEYQGVQLALAEGNIPTVFARCLSALYSYTPLGNPFLTLDLVWRPRHQNQEK